MSYPEELSKAGGDDIVVSEGMKERSIAFSKFTFLPSPSSHPLFSPRFYRSLRLLIKMKSMHMQQNLLLLNKITFKTLK